jgi:glycosyltransferase involved in cell wall biosynthesis
VSAPLRVLCLVPYPTLGASNRLRVEQYAPALRNDGIELVISPFLDDAGYAVLYRPGHTVPKIAAVVKGFIRRARDLARARRFDLVLVHREATLIGPPLVERALDRIGVPYLYDFDDAIFVVAPYAANRGWNRLRPPSRIAEIARRAAVVVTGNDYLAEWARRQNARVVILPTPVDTDRHTPSATAHPAAPLVIGWVGSPTTAPYLRLLDEPLRRLGQERSIVVRVIGGAYEHATVPVELQPYRLADEPAQVASFDIGVLPEPDDQWTRGKGAFKALLYMASAVPVVASRVGVNPDVVAEGEAGFNVDGPDEWLEALRRLAGDADLRRRMGAAGRARAVERYSVRSLAPRLAGALRLALTRGPQ